MFSFDCNLSSHKADLFFHLTLDCPTTIIALLSTFWWLPKSNAVHATGLWKWFFASDIIFLIYLPISLFSPSLTIRNCQDPLVKHIKWNSSAPYWIAVRHCMLRKSFLAFIAILFFLGCFVFFFFFYFSFFIQNEEASIGGEIRPPGRVFQQPLSHSSQHCPLGLPTHLFAHCWAQLPHLLPEQRVVAQELQTEDPCKEHWQLSHLIVAGQSVLLAIQQRTQSKNFRQKASWTLCSNSWKDFTKRTSCQTSLNDKSVRVRGLAEEWSLPGPLG